MIINSSSTASVTTKQQSNIGGLVGTNSGQIIASTSNGRVSNTWGGNVGGLVGENTGMILDSSQADGEVQGSGLASVGGLVGLNGNGGTINRATSSSARVYLSGTTASVGGLVGMNAAGATISNSEALGRMSTPPPPPACGSAAVGVNDGDIRQSAARVREVRAG